MRRGNRCQVGRTQEVKPGVASAPCALSATDPSQLSRLVRRGSGTALNHRERAEATAVAKLREHPKSVVGVAAKLIAHSVPCLIYSSVP